MKEGNGLGMPLGDKRDKNHQWIGWEEMRKGEKSTKKIKKERQERGKAVRGKAGKCHGNQNLKVKKLC